MSAFVSVWLVLPRCEATIWVCLICVTSTYPNGAVQVWVDSEFADDCKAHVAHKPQDKKRKKAS